MILADLPRLTAEEYRDRFAGTPMLSVAMYVLDEAGFQRHLPEARRMIRRRSRGHRIVGAFVITDPPPLPDGVDPAAMTVALTSVKD